MKYFVMNSLLFLFTIAYIFVFTIIYRRTRTVQKNLEEKINTINNQIQEQIFGWRVVKLNQKEKLEIVNWEKEGF